MNTVFTIIYLIWFLSEIILTRLLRSKNIDRKKADQGSLAIIWTTIIISISAIVVISKFYHIQISTFNSLPYIGLFIIVVGEILRLAIILSLGQFFTVDVTIKPDHKLKMDGFYKYVRHPSYSAILLSFIGLGISQNCWIILIFVLIAVGAAFLYRIKIEEKILIQQFGSEYLSYMNKTKKLIPFIF
jgi:protein-S-isoprenylcysteine O-methyltransferase Ste14